MAAHSQHLMRKCSNFKTTVIISREQEAYFFLFGISPLSVIYNECARTLLFTIFKPILAYTEFLTICICKWKHNACSPYIDESSLYLK